MDTLKSSLNVDEAVRGRYSNAAQQAEPSLCCPVDYDQQYLEVLPQELLERDYGCGDPSSYVEPGDAVLDLGSGGGKICYIASQIVGSQGRVIGVDMNNDMLDLARRYQHQIGDAIGYHNTDFRKGCIQDLALDLDKFETYLANQPIRGSDQWVKAEAHAEHLRTTDPMIASDSVDVVISNCVLNLVAQRDRSQLFREVFRVLQRGGRAVISDIVCDEPVPQHLRNDPKLWSGCISGAFVEHEFLEEFERAGFYGVQLLARQEEPWACVEGIEFRSVTVRAFKGKEGPCLDHHQAVIYNGPWKSVTDDDGHVLRRGVRTAVCQKTFDIYSRAPYASHIFPVPPHLAVSDQDAQQFDCRRNLIRDPRESKRPSFDLTQLPGQDCCDSGDGCC